jgi:HAD superfamily hydrolase (TIGR01509 family)
MSEKLNNIKAIIFDMDGAMLDSESISDITWKMAADEKGLAVNDEILNACRGTNKNDTMTILKKYYGADFDSEAFLERTSQFFHEIEEKDGIPLLPYAKEILEYLKPRYRLALASSTRGPTVERQLRAAGVIDFFETRTTGEMVVHSKPDPEIYLMACKSIGVNPDECAAIEDSLNGIRSAHAAGLHPVMVIDKVQPTEEIKKMCEHIFDSLDGLKTIL